MAPPANTACSVDVDAFADDVMHHVRAVAAKGEELCQLEPGWDGADARKIDPESVRNAVSLIAKVACAECLTPGVSPTPEGTLILDWTWGEDHVEAELGPGLEFEVLVQVEGTDAERVLRLNDSSHLHWLSWHVTGVGVDRFDS